MKIFQSYDHKCTATFLWFGPQKTRIMGLPSSEDSLTIGWAVSTQYQRVTDRRTDIHNVRSMTDAR